MPPLVSVIVPAYGVGEYLPACLESLRAQTLTDLEVIVVDDGSPDETGEIADDFAKIDPRIKVLHTQNQGLGPARDAGSQHASGKYLAFVDSDDLVPPRSYELMVQTLESTGSDFAAGNAWRYIEGKGISQSWTHRNAFAETKLRTHISLFPELVFDRMAWNKVYRRSFWEEKGFSFPAMRYEDYPVSLRVHLEASSVDILQEKVYVWRQRIAENSITQRSMELDNLRDRVKSAHMCLDVVANWGGEIAAKVQGIFTDVDIITLATALAEGQVNDRDEIADLAVNLARRLTARSDLTTALARCVLKALKNGDVEAAAVLAELRRDGHKAELLRIFSQPKRITQFPGIFSAFALGNRSMPQIRHRVLKSRALEAIRLDDGYQIQIETKLRRLLLEHAKITASLECAGQSVTLPSNVMELIGQRARIEVKIPDSLIETLTNQPHRLRVQVAVGPATWEGDVSIGRNQLPEPHPLPSGNWGVLSQYGVGDPHVTVNLVAESSLVNLRLTDESLQIAVDTAYNQIAVLRPAPSRPLIREVRDGIAEFLFKDLLQGDPADDPVTSRTFREIVALLPEDDLDLTNVPDAQAVEAPAEQNLEGRGTVRLIAREVPEAEVLWGEYVFTVVRSPALRPEIGTQREDHIGIA